MRFVLISLFSLSCLFTSGCASTKSGTARETINPAHQVVDGFPANYKRGNPVRNAFNTFRR